MADSAEGPKISGGSSPPANPVRFVPLVVLGILFSAIGLVFGTQFCSAQHKKTLLRTGAPGVAEIVAVVDTGNRYNRDPEVELTLSVSPWSDEPAPPPQAEPFTASLTEVLDAYELQTYTVGTKIWVRYDPANPRDLAIAGLYDETEVGSSDSGVAPAAGSSSTPPMAATAAI